MKTIFALVSLCTASMYNRYSGRPTDSNNPVEFDPMNLGSVAQHFQNQKEIDKVRMFRVQQMISAVQEHEDRLMGKFISIK